MWQRAGGVVTSSEELGVVSLPAVSQRVSKEFQDQLFVCIFLSLQSAAKHTVSGIFAVFLFISSNFTLFAGVFSRCDAFAWSRVGGAIYSLLTGNIKSNPMSAFSLSPSCGATITFVFTRRTASASSVIVHWLPMVINDLHLSMKVENPP